MAASLWYYGVLLDAVATLAGACGKQLLRHAAVTGEVCGALAGQKRGGSIFSQCAEVCILGDKFLEYRSMRSA